VRVEQSVIVVDSIYEAVRERFRAMAVTFSARRKPLPWPVSSSTVAI
jgi:hypothetical protein